MKTGLVAMTHFSESISNLPVVIATFEADNNINPPTAGTVILGEDAEGIKD